MSRRSSAIGAEAHYPDASYRAQPGDLHWGATGPLEAARCGCATPLVQIDVDDVAETVERRCFSCGKPTPR